MPFAKWRQFQSGKGRGRAGFRGLQLLNTTSVGNVGAGEDDLISVTLEADSLHANGQTLEITAWGTCEANGNNKTAKLHFGGTEICTTGAVAANDKRWMLKALVHRTAVAVQKAIAWGTFNDAEVALQRTALTKDETATQIIKVTGEATADNDIICDALMVEVLTR